MAAITFDKLAYIETLKASGIPEQQARAHTQALDSALHDAVATQHDIAELKRDIVTAEANLKRDISEMELRLKHDLTLRMGGMMVGGIALVVTLLKLLPAAG